MVWVDLQAALKWHDARLEPVAGLGDTRSYQDRQQFHNKSQKDFKRTAQSSLSETKCFLCFFLSKRFVKLLHCLIRTDVNVDSFDMTVVAFKSWVVLFCCCGCISKLSQETQMSQEAKNEPEALFLLLGSKITHDLFCYDLLFLHSGIWPK